MNHLIHRLWSVTYELIQASELLPDLDVGLLMESMLIKKVRFEDLSSRKKQPINLHKK